MTTKALVKVDDNPPGSLTLGVANGMPGPLDSSGLLPAAQIPGPGSTGSITLKQAIAGWATGSAFVLSGSQTYDATYGTLTGASIAWPDAATGVFASTGIDTTSTNPGGLTGFTATHVSGGVTLTATVVIPRNSSGQVAGTMTVTVA